MFAPHMGLIAINREMGSDCIENLSNKEKLTRLLTHYSNVLVSNLSRMRVIKLTVE